MIKTIVIIPLLLITLLLILLFALLLSLTLHTMQHRYGLELAEIFGVSSSLPSQVAFVSSWSSQVAFNVLFECLVILCIYIVLLYVSTYTAIHVCLVVMLIHVSFVVCLLLFVCMYVRCSLQGFGGNQTYVERYVNPWVGSTDPNPVSKS